MEAPPHEQQSSSAPSPHRLRASPRSEGPRLVTFLQLIRRHPRRPHRSHRSDCRITSSSKHVRSRQQISLCDLLHQFARLGGNCRRWSADAVVATPLPPSRSGRVNPNASRHACGTDESQPTLHSSHPSRFDATPLTELGANSQEKHLVPAAPSIFYVNPIGHGERSDPSSAPLSSFKHDNRECG